VCGISGFCDKNQKLDKKTLKNMTDVLHHRGPDDSGYSFYELEDSNIGLGHRRLSIQDLSSHGHQPMIDMSKNYEIVYNGEVYNFKELKEKYLEDINFISSSDTEVILYLYIKFGNKFVEKLIGMFSITIYDKRLNKLKLFIDRAGVKPLYYSIQNNIFVFASELKSFHKVSDISKNIDKKSLKLYFQYSYIPSPYTIFENIYKLEAGHFLELDINTFNIKKEKYWDIVDFYNKPKIDKPYKDIKKDIKKLLDSAFNYRMVSDVPVGIFLSGGYDSSIVAAILQKTSKQKLKTFSIGFEQKDIDEAPFAKEISKYLNTEHHEYYVSNQDSLDLIPKLAQIYDEPMGDVSAIPTYLVSKLAKEHVTVALSGDGGDEIFGGYPNRYIEIPKLYNRLNKLPKIVIKLLNFILNHISTDMFSFIVKKILRKNITNTNGKFNKLKNTFRDISINGIYKSSVQYFNDKELNKFVIDCNSSHLTLYDEIDKTNGTFADKAMALDFKTYMYQILTKVDRASMAVSLESREPLLDHRIAQYLAQVSSNEKLKYDTKGILKDILHDYIPKEMMDRPKQGFVPPYETWLKEPLKDMVIRYSSVKYIEEQNIFDKQFVDNLVNNFYIKNTDGYKLWLFLNFQLWYKEWIVNE
jgi:asparagine synthase (glutamine-hydrolysing)